MLNMLAIRTLPEESQIISSLPSTELFFAIALFVIGSLLVLFGYKAYKFIVVFNCIALGFWLGGILGQRAQIATVCAVVGALLFGAISWPLMKYAVAVCGGLVGAVIGMLIWAYCEQPVEMAWAGGLIGLVVLGMLSFILFKTSVILFTCVQGSAMLVLGATALLMKYTSWSSDINNNLVNKPALMPILISSVAILGLLWQHQRHGFIGHEGAPGSSGKSSSSSTSTASTDAKKK